MNTDEVRDYFDRMAGEYETLINRLVPYYQKQNSLMMDLIPFQRHDTFQALDLGAGTGVLSRLLLDTFPNAHVTAFDLSGVMLDTCKKKLWAYPNRAKFIQGDFTAGQLGHGYDVIFTALLLQHTNDSGRAQFFKQAVKAMKPGGILISRDVVRGNTPRLSDEYDRLWKLYMRAQGEDGGQWYAKFKAKDQPATVAEQLKNMTEAGFIDVDCHWRYLNFAITGGRKPK